MRFVMTAAAMISPRATSERRIRGVLGTIIIGVFLIPIFMSRSRPIDERVKNGKSSITDRRKD